METIDLGVGLQQTYSTIVSQCEWWVGWLGNLMLMMIIVAAVFHFGGFGSNTLAS